MTTREASFTSSDPSVQGSTSSPDNLVVGKDSTTTALGVSNPSPNVNQSVTYTATVTPTHSGATEPSGSVGFLDGGAAIGSCTSQPLTAGASSSTATCTVSYASAGSHSITATYSADANFTGSSSSPPQTVTVQQPPSGSTPSGSTPSGSTPSGSTPSGSPSGGSPPTISQILAALAQVLAPQGKSAKIGALLKLGGYTFSFAAPSGGTLLITWYYLPKGAHITRKAKPVAVASGRATVTKSGAMNVTVRLTPKGKQLLKHVKTLNVTTKATFTPTTGSSASAKRSFTLRR